MLNWGPSDRRFHGSPIWMLNLLRFRRRFDVLGEQKYHDAVTSYREYGGALKSTAGPSVGLVSRLGTSGSAVFTLNGPFNWDSAMFVEYPSRDHFLSMVGSDMYHAAHPARATALEQGFLIACRAEPSALHPSQHGPSPLAAFRAAAAKL